MLLVACNTTDYVKHITFIPVRHFIIPETGALKTLSFQQKLFSEKDSILTLTDRNKGILYFWKLNDHLFFDSVDLSVFPEVEIQNYEAVNSDSFVVLFNPARLGGLHDSVALLMNRRKEILGVFHTRGLPVKLSQPEFEKMGRRHFVFQYTHPLLFDNENKTISLALSTLGSRSCNEPLATLALVPLDTLDKTYLIPYMPDSCRDDEYMPSDLKLLSGDRDKCGNYLFSALYSSKVLVYQSKTQKQYYIDVPFYDFEAIKPLKQNQLEGLASTSYSKYGLIYYDDFQKGFWRTGFRKRDKNSKFFRVQLPHYVMFIEGKSYHKKAEGILPPYFIGPFIPFKNLLLVKNTFLTAQTGKTVYTALKYDYDSITTKNYQKEYNNFLVGLPTKKGVDAYINTYTEDKNTSVIIIPVNNICPSCQESLIELLKNQQVEKRKIRILMIFPNSNNAESFLAKHHILNWKTNNLYLDTTARWLDYTPPFPDVKYYKRKGKKLYEMECGDDSAIIEYLHK